MAWLRGSFPTVRAEVEDVVQESYLRMWKRHALRPIVSAKAFLFQSARNIAIDLLRRNKISPLDAGSLANSSVIDESPNAVEALTTREKTELLADALAALPERCYEVVHLHKFCGLSQKAVAERLGISERTVQGHVLSAVRQCEAYLRARGVKSLND